ncbi:hypothetical protein [Legionella jamestowniensis]|uniref:Lipoprotein n=1 Tax=Legionella jamestowniensis TaxID=455 RepID=A0A0W0UKZ0_9GAMM|nr:hypothetical protein [Legionella jamestowniensis]KTD08574.1 hypothetical protein Ljam_2769 [Legionella jamestowniensis]SFL53033.1 hypothetical protein SAMN02746073_0712 [Legionella jamestowniensis DSM 19215]
MNKLIYCMAVFLPGFVFAQGCIVGGKPDRPRYVCMDGRSLSQTSSGLLWHAKRGCFMSKIPCCAYDATHYAYSANPSYVYYSYKKCREGYPYHWGEMQTH